MKCSNRVFVSLFLSAGCLSAAPISFTLFQFPGSKYTSLNGVNNNGDIVGGYGGAAGVQHGFLLTASGALTTFDPPGSTSTVAEGINDAGQIAGFSAPYPWTAFLRSSDGTYTSTPLVAFSGIADNGFVSGFTTGGAQSFVIDPSGHYSYFADPVSSVFSTFASGVNQSGVAVGYYNSGSGNGGFIRDASGNSTSIMAPGCAQTVMNGINDSGISVGHCGNGTNFTLSPAGQFQFITLPGIDSLSLNGINANGEMVGTAMVNGIVEGVVINAVPECSSFLAVGMGLLLVFFFVQRRPGLLT